MERIIGQYRLDHKVGEGGMAEVWQATHLHLNRRVAIKFLLPRFAGDAELEERFLNEGKRQARLQHPNIVSATDFIQSEGRSYLVMEYVEGESMESRLEALNGPLSLEEVHAISWDILSALDYAHSQDPPLVHRDVKPSNILIEASGRVFLTDFGIALALGAERRLTTAGTSVGTPDYMSPEQIVRPKAIDRRSDVYSFGCVLYTMLTGTPPFSIDGATEFSIKDAHVRNAPPPISARNPYLSPALEAVVLKCMEKDPANRFQTCLQVMSALDEAINVPTAVLASATHDVQSEETPHQFAVAAPPAYAPSALPYSPPPYTPAPAHATPPPPAFVPEPARGNKWKLSATIGGVVALAGVAAWFFWPSPETVLRLDGSATVAGSLAPELLKAFAEHEGGTSVAVQSKVANDGSEGKAKPLEVRAKMPGKWRPQVFQVRANGSESAFKALQAKTAEIGMASRRIDGKEAKELAEIGDMKSPASEIVLGLDGTAVIVNRSNDVAALTRKQIADIFAGRIADWSAVGGRPGAIHLYGTNSDSETADTFAALVLEGNKKAFSPDLKIKENGEAVADAVAGDPGGAGYVDLRQIGSTKAVAVSDGPGTSALMPTPFTVATEDYILSHRLYLYLPRNPTPMARRFAAFVQGPDGQEVVRKVHFVGQKGDLAQASVAPTAPEDYRKLTSGKRRMMFDFRFEPGSDDLDTKALADLDRAVNSLSALNIRDVYLFGFADNRGTFEKNQELSMNRAVAVGKRLQERGLNVYTQGFSGEMPVADNGSEDGRSRNRRVEVWVQ